MVRVACAGLLLAVSNGLVAAQTGPPRPNGLAAPSLPANATLAWADAYAKARATVLTLTNAEKNNITLGQSGSVVGLLFPNNGCTGTSGGVSRVGFHGLCLQDGPAGVRASDGVSAFPAGIHLGASWNRSLVGEVGRFMGKEFKTKGASIMLGPTVGPIGRVAMGGRNWENYGADPYLAGQLGASAITGIEQSVMACVKHFIANEQELYRNPGLTSYSVSSNMDERTMHEMYLWPFQDAVNAGVSSVMCSYNRVNGHYACENNGTLNGLLKDELGFKGFVVSDWTGQRSGLLSATSGLDMVMPDAGSWANDVLITAVKNGSLPQARLDDMATRVLAAWYKHGMDAPSWPKLGVGLVSNLLKPHTFVDARDPASKATIFQAAVEGQVLVKNVDNILPLKKPKLLSLFGFDAPAPLVNNPTSLPASNWALGAQSADVSLAQMAVGIGVGVGSMPETATKGTLTVGSGSGANTGPYISAPIHAFEQQAYEDGTYLHWDFSSVNPDVNGASEACVVFLNELALEGVDRTTLANKNADTLVQNVAKQCKNTIVVIHNAGIRLVDAWIENPNIKAVILAHLPGQDSGRALTEVMFGRQSPTGRLPYTIAKKPEDYGALLKPEGKAGADRSYQSNFTEGLYIDYRAFQKNKIAPRYAFGYGLTYTTFNYSSLSVKPPTNPSPGTSSSAALFEQIASVSCTIANTGKFSTAEVAQLYIGIPDSPARQLRGFQKTFISAGSSTAVNFPLTRRDVSIWDATLKQWQLQKGTYKVYVGSSVEDIKLEGSFVI